MCIYLHACPLQGYIKYIHSTKGKEGQSMVHLQSLMWFTSCILVGSKAGSLSLSLSLSLSPIEIEFVVNMLTSSWNFLMEYLIKSPGLHTFTPTQTSPYSPPVIPLYIMYPPLSLIGFIEVTLACYVSSLV